jgi:uncharacterized membrane protein YdjX (TVP38/TMEM64 family)
MNKNLMVKLGVIAIMIISLIVATKYLGIDEIIAQNFQNALAWIQGLGYWGAIIFIAIYIIATVLLIPGAILTLGAGFVFGVIKGSILVSIASTLGATAAFLVGRYFARGWVARQIERQPKFKAIDEAVAKDGWKIVGLTRLSPIFPFIFLNYAFAVTQVSLLDYILASWIGMMPGTVMYVYFGSLAQNLASLSAGVKAPIWLQLTGFIATVVVTVYVTKIAKKALDSQIGSGFSGLKDYQDFNS